MIINGLWFPFKYKIFHLDVLKSSLDLLMISYGGGREGKWGNNRYLPCKSTNTAQKLGHTGYCPIVVPTDCRT